MAPVRKRRRKRRKSRKRKKRRRRRRRRRRIQKKKKKEKEKKKKKRESSRLPAYCEELRAPLWQDRAGRGKRELPTRFSQRLTRPIPVSW